MRIKLLLTFALLLTAVTGAWALTPKGDDVWDETTKTLTVNSNPEANAYSVNTDIQHLVIASGVTSIGNNAFAGCSNIATMTVDASNTKYDSRNGCNAIIEKSTNTLIVGCKNTTIPDDVTSIRSDAFKFCSGLTSIEIPASVTSIGNSAFFGCSGLATVTYAAGSKLTSIGNYVFEDCSGLTSIEIPAGVTTIGNSAFQGCSGLTSIEIPANVTSIGGSAFNGCSNLTTVTVYAPSCTLGGNAFGGCGNLANIYVLRGYKDIYRDTDNWRTYSDNIKEMDIPHDRCGDVKWVLTGKSPNYALTITGKGAMADYDNFSDQPWYDYAENIKIIVIGADVTSIGDYAFAGTGLTSIVIPASVTSIGNNAFWGCEGLTSIEIPASVESIGVSAFIDCSNIVTMTVDGDNAVYDSRDNCNAIIGKSSNTLIVGCKNTTIPDDVTSIGNSAFYGCTGLTSIEIPASVGSIGDFAFAGTGLTSIEIPASVTSIGDNAFRGCSELATVTVYTPSCTLGVDAFDYCRNLTNIYVFSDLVGDYKAADNWKTYAGIITGITGGYCGTTDHETNVVWVLTGESPNYTLTITGTGAMADYASSSDQPWKDYRSSIKTVVIGAGVTSIGNYTFAYCTGLTSIEIPASVTSIGGSAFWNCSYLATVTFAEDSQLTSIGNNAFNNTGLTSINIPASVTTIGNDAFRNCSGLATVTFAAGSQLTSIGNIAFNYTGLTSINIPASVTSIGNGAFINCSNLEAMTVDGENAVYDSRDNCNAIIEKSSNTLIAGCKNTTIPDDVTIIRDYAFNGCTGLTSIEIPASVTSIGGYAFYGCTGLTSIEIPAGVTSIGVSAFEGCSGLTSIEIPAGVTSIGGSTFYGCTGLTSIEIPASVTTIGNSALKNCSNLATVTVYAPSCTLGDFAFSGCDKLANIYVFSDLVDTYQIKKNWKTYAGKIKGITGGYCGTTDHETDVVWVLTGESPNYTLTITGTGAMADYVPSDQPWKDYRSSIKTFVIGNGVTTIGNLAFGRCTGLTSINIPSSVTSIGCYAFYNTNLTSIEIPASVTSIDYEAFSGCTGLTSVTFATGSQLTSIGDATFQSCSSLTSIEIPASVENIGDQAFDNCSSLTSIIIPASVTSIGDHAFDNCSNLATITVYAPDCTLGGSAFSGCNKLTNIYVLSNKVVSYKSAWSAYADKIAVIFDGTSTTTVNFDNDVTVNGVLYNRTFTASKPSTVMLPFSLGEGQMLTGGTLYKFTGVTKNETTGKWEATMTETATLQANTPYLLLPDENLVDGKVTFNLNNSTVTLNTKDGGDKETADQGSHWKFKGTYEYMKWTTDTSDPDYSAEREAEIGRAYGFAGVAKTGIEVGDFVKVASGAKIRPMGCYLLWSDTPNASRAAARGAATEELPQSITVRLVGSNGEITAIGEIDTKTGEMTFDSEAWYTLNGVRLSGKPTKKGLYINNGRKVVVK